MSGMLGCAGARAGSARQLASNHGHNNCIAIHRILIQEIPKAKPKTKQGREIPPLKKSWKKVSTKLV